MILYENPLICFRIQFIFGEQALGVSFRSLALLLITSLTVSSLLVIQAAVATSKPSVPEFTLKIVARPYDVAPATTIDPYTGKTTTIHGGYYVENKSIDITIKNKMPYSTDYSSGPDVWYQIQYKGYYEDTWKTYYSPKSQYEGYILQPKGDYTVVSIPCDDFPKEAIVDFKIREAVGGFEYLPHGLFWYDYYKFNGEVGDWSSTQAINLSSQNSATNPNLTHNPTNPVQTSISNITFTFSVGSISSLFLAVIVGLIVILIVVVLTIMIIRKKS
ncbi:MAG: hypothetical protein ACQCN3_12370 [Candidatus Bathyarchaeia archaeon]|jgi:hypothetical protein